MMLDMIQAFVRSARRNHTAAALRLNLEGSIRTTTSDEMLDAWKHSPLHRLTPVMLDRKYRVASLDAIMNFVGWSNLDKRKYVAEYFDCDDFACSLRSQARRQFKLNSVGEVIDYSGRHAYNAIAVHTGDGSPIKIVIAEPQTDAVWDRLPDGKMYVGEQGFAVF